MGLSLGFGSSSKKTNQTSTVDKTEATNQTKTGTTNETQNQSQTGSSIGSQSSTGSSTTSQTSNTQGQSTNQSTQQVTGSSLGGDIISGASQFLSKLFSGEGNVNVGQFMGDFDPEAFVNKQIAAASQSGESTIQSTIQGLASLVGGTSDTNSMTALMNESLHRDLDATLAQVGAQATQTAQGIQQGWADAAIKGQNSNMAGIAEIINAIKGGQTTQAATSQEHGSQSQTGTTTGQTTTSENQQSQQQTAQQSTTSIVQQLIEALQGTTHTTGTENVKGKTSGSSFGIGLS